MEILKLKTKRMAIYSDQEDPNHIMWNKENEKENEVSISVEKTPSIIPWDSQLLIAASPNSKFSSSCMSKIEPATSKPSGCHDSTALRVVWSMISNIDGRNFNKSVDAAAA